MKVNPQKIKASRKFFSIEQKTDKADAILIARYGEIAKDPSYQKIPYNIKELRDLYRCSLALKKQAAECKNHLEHKKTMSESVINMV